MHGIYVHYSVETKLTDNASEAANASHCIRMWEIDSSKRYEIGMSRAHLQQHIVMTERRYRGSTFRCHHMGYGKVTLYAS